MQLDLDSNVLTNPSFERLMLPVHSELFTIINFLQEFEIYVSTIYENKEKTQISLLVVDNVIKTNHMATTQI